MRPAPCCSGPAPAHGRQPERPRQRRRRAHGRGRHRRAGRRASSIPVAAAARREAAGRGAVLRAATAGGEAGITAREQRRVLFSHARRGDEFTGKTEVSVQVDKGEKRPTSTPPGRAMAKRRVGAALPSPTCPPSVSGKRQLT